MKKRSNLFLRLALPLAMAVCILGCDDDDPRSTPVGPDLQGKWNGSFSGGGQTESISAKVSHDGNVVVIGTSKASPPGQNFSGTIDETGYLVLTDASDGETWSTYHTHATANHLRISDFRVTPTASNRQPPMNVIDLTR